VYLDLLRVANRGIGHVVKFSGFCAIHQELSWLTGGINLKKKNKISHHAESVSTGSMDTVCQMHVVKFSGFPVNIHFRLFPVSAVFITCADSGLRLKHLFGVAHRASGMP